MEIVGPVYKGRQECGSRVHYTGMGASVVRSITHLDYNIIDFSFNAFYDKKKKISTLIHKCDLTRVKGKYEPYIK